jgi:hypothetical protein
MDAMAQSVSLSILKMEVKHLVSWLAISMLTYQHAYQACQEDIARNKTTRNVRDTLKAASGTVVLQMLGGWVLELLYPQFPRVQAGNALTFHRPPSRSIHPVE